jgi:hypothetical protein
MVARAHNRHLVWLVAISLLTLAAYSRSFSGEFQFDDYQIVNNPVVQQPDLYGLLRWARTRILPFVTFVLNYEFGGENPFAYHLANFSIHLLATLGVFHLALALCQTPHLRNSALNRQGSTFAGAAALLFACHPLQIQAVTYIAQRVSSMATLFYVASILFYVRARNRQTIGMAGAGAAYVASFALAVAAFLSKENAVTLPIMVLLTELVFFRGTGMRKNALRFVPLALVVLTIPLVWLLLPAQHPLPVTDSLPWLKRQTVRLLGVLSQAAESESVSPLDYFLTQCVVLPRYLRMVFLPYGFNVDHDVPFEHHLTATVVAGFAFLAVVFSVGVHMTRRSPVIGFGILWFFTSLAVESTFVPIRDPMNEHRMYLAMPGVSFALAGLFVWSAERQTKLTWIVGTAFVAVLCTATFVRNEAWRTQRALWQAALAKSPGKARVHVNYGTALHLDGELDEAIEHYCRALEIEPGNKRARSNINLAQQEQIDRGEAAVEVRQQPDGTIVGVAIDPCPPSPTEGSEGRR